MKLFTFRQVGEYTPPDAEHPFQGWLPCLKLVWQPSVQLLEVLSILASLANTESDAGDDVCAAGDVRRAATLFAGRDGVAHWLLWPRHLLRCLDRDAGQLGGRRRFAILPDRSGRHSNAVDRIATAEGAINFDDDLMTCPPELRDGNAVPMRERYHTPSELEMTRRRHGSQQQTPTARLCCLASARCRYFAWRLQQFDRDRPGWPHKRTPRSGPTFDAVVASKRFGRDPHNRQACPARIMVSQSGAPLAMHKTPHNGVQPCNLIYFSFGPLFWED